VLARGPFALEVEQRDVRARADTDRGQRQPVHGGAGAHALNEQLELECTAQHEPAVERREGRLQAGRAHRRLLEGHLLLVARVRSVVGRDAVDRAVAQPLHERCAVALAGERRMHLHARVEAADGLVGEQQMMR